VNSGGAPWFGELAGLEPRSRLIVGRGFSREAIKTEILRSGQAIAQTAILGVEDLYRLWVPEYQPDRTLSSSGRQEILRKLVSQPQVSARLHEIRSLKRQRGFFKRLDRGVQSLRTIGATRDEREVIEARISEKESNFETRAPRAIRQEVRLLVPALEIVLETQNLWDRPRLAQIALDRIQSGEWPEALDRVSEWKFLSIGHEDAIEQLFIEEFSRAIQGRELGTLTLWSELPGPTAVEDATPSPQVRWERWHTLDDAAWALASELSNWAREGRSLSQVSILFADQPEARRSLVSALKRHGLPIEDPRDPTRVRSSEVIKRVLEPLRLVAHGGNLEDWVGWLGRKNASAVQALYQSGKIRLSLSDLDQIPEFSSELKEEVRTEWNRWSRRLKFSEFESALLDSLASKNTLLEVTQFLKGLLEQWREELNLLEFRAQPAPLLYWLERFEARLEESAPWVDYARPRTGLGLYRLDQAPILSAMEQVIVFCAPERWVAVDGVGDIGVSDREREWLGGDFKVRSAPIERAERIAILKQWTQRAQNLWILDSSYDLSGRELPSTLPLWVDIHPQIAQTPIEECGAISRWLGGYEPPPEVSLEPFILPDLHSGRTEMRASELDLWSRCTYLGLAQQDWKLEDHRVSEIDLRPEVHGNVLHRAAQLLMEPVLRKMPPEDLAPDSERIQQALHQAWKETPKPGWIPSLVLTQATQRRLGAILSRLLEVDQKARSKSQAKIAFLENPRLALDVEGVRVQGRPDRIDQTQAGWMILDYKSGSKIPRGDQMLEFGYRLQLPAYALALQKDPELSGPVAGVQFVELTRAGTRSKGVFFEEFSGKDLGKPYNLRKGIKSLLPANPEETWQKFEEKIRAEIRNWKQAHVEARPKLEIECEGCRMRAVCGRHRAIEVAENAEQGGQS
jgi:RecB family exonuclease